MKKTILFALFVGILVASCTKDKAQLIGCTTCDDCDTVPHKFAADVFPIFQANCVSCHSGANPPRGYAWTSHENIAQLDRIQRILSAIKHETTPTMPAFPVGAKLSDADIHTIECWVNSGMQND